MELYQALIQFRDSDLSPFFVKEADESNCIRIKRVNETNRGKSLVELIFTQDEYRQIFLSDDSDEYSNASSVIDACESGRENIFVDSYWGDEEVREGYVFSYFNEENTKLLKDILKYTNPSLLEKDMNQESSEIGRFLYDKFHDDVNDIGYEFSYRYDDALKQGCLQYVNNKLCGRLTSLGIIEKRCGEEYVTTVDILITFWNSITDSRDLSIVELFNQYAEKYNLKIDEDLYEDYYNYFDYENFDSDGFNREVERVLERRLEKILEDFNEGRLVEYEKFYTLINKLGYKMKTWINFPSSKSFGGKTKSMFKINYFDDGKIVVDYSESGNFGGVNVQKMTMNFEDFKNFLYHPELF